MSRHRWDGSARSQLFLALAIAGLNSETTQTVTVSDEPREGCTRWITTAPVSEFTRILDAVKNGDAAADELVLSAGRSPDFVRRAMITSLFRAGEPGAMVCGSEPRAAP
jgi:hypothetical protein